MELERKEQTKPKVSRKKEIIKIRLEKKIRKKIENNKIELFFKNVNKFDNTQEKREKSKKQNYKWKNRHYTATEIQKIILNSYTNYKTN